MNPGNDNPAARAEFYLCLARAFLPPRTDNDHRAFTVYLTDDLADLAGEIGYPISEPLTQLRAAFDALPGSLALLQLYSKLFLTPPTPVALNTGRYLDGAVMGGSVQAIEGWYRRRGLERTESFHDLPDHVALQLEFVARLFAGAAAARQAGDDAEARRLEAEARAFLGAFVVHWLPGFCAALERTHAERRLPALCRDLDEADAYGSAGVYAALADVLQTAVAHDFACTATASDLVAPPLASSPDNGSARHASDQIRCQNCGTAFIATEEMHDILLTLKRSGLGTEHLELCPECRTQSMGLSRLPTPDPKRLRH